MSRRQQSGAHRDVHLPWRLTLRCWWSGHTVERLSNGYVLCTHCERIAPSPVELP